MTLLGITPWEKESLIYHLTRCKEIIEQNLNQSILLAGCR